MFDPKVYFDRLSNRFFVVALLQNNKPKQSFIYLSVSRSSSVVSLENGWCNYRIRGKRSNTWADYPGLGMNGSWLAISANNFKFGGLSLRRGQVSLVDNASSCPKLKLFVFKAPEVPGDFWNYKATTVQPAQHYTESNLPRRSRPAPSSSSSSSRPRRYLGTFGITRRPPSSRPSTTPRATYSLVFSGRSPIPRSQWEQTSRPPPSPPQDPAARP